MKIWLVAYFGGLFTILSPCILPVLPFVFAGAGRPFRRRGLPLLGGMAATFAIISALTVVGTSWVIHASQWGRWIALGLLSVFAASLLSPRLASWLAHPFTRLGNSIDFVPREEPKPGRSFVLGVATGFLWVPCAGPILGLILTGAAIEGASVHTSLLLLSYAMGAATSLALALLAGGRVARGLRGLLGAQEWLRGAAGVVVLLGVLAIALGWDRGILARLSRLGTDKVEESVISLAHAEASMKASGPGILSSLQGADGWINSGPLTPEALRGKVVLIDFWTYSCINCLRTLPHIKAWADKYRDQGLVVIGVHTPEFAFEKIEANVRKAVRELGIAYPVALDSRYAIWNAFHNQYWPAHYFIDKEGRTRHQHFGEGGYDESERMIQSLLGEGGAHATGTVQVAGEGAEAEASSGPDETPETYIGYARAANQVLMPAVARDKAQKYQLAARLLRDQFSLSGTWNVQAETALLEEAPGKIVFRFHARDLHLVLGPGPTGKPVRFLIRLDGTEPGQDHGVDIDASGRGQVEEHRLYQMIRQKGGAADRTFEIQFLDPGVEAFAFTFG